MKFNYKIRSRGELGNFILELSIIDNQIISRHWWWIEQLQVKDLRTFQPVWSISIESLESFERTQRWIKKNHAELLL